MKLTTEKVMVVNVGLMALFATTFCLSAIGGTASVFDEDTIAFYPFDNGTVGEFQANQYNAVDSSSYLGTACKNPSNLAGSTTRMSDETPGKYVYSGVKRTEDKLVYTDPRSLRLGSGTFYAKVDQSTYGYLEIPSVSVELSKHHTTGFTVEFFFKMNPEDGWYPSSYQIGFDAGFVVNGTTTARIKTLLPSGSSEYKTRMVVNSTSSGVNNKDIVSDTDLKTKIAGFTSVRDGKWHHYAFVEDPSDGTLKYYLDGTLVGSKTKESINITVQEITSGGYFNIGRVCGGEYSFGAAISCLRFSKTALSAAEFLTVSDEQPYPSDVVAAYAFKDGAAGASAAGTGVLKNAIDASANAGDVVLATTAGANATATYDADAPANYIFVGKRSSINGPIYSNPQSIKLTSEVVGNSAQINISRLGTELSKLHETGYTVEYFVKYLDENQAGFAPAFCSYTCGYPDNFRLYMPVAVNATWRKSLVYSIGSRETSGVPSSISNLPFDFVTDMKWHHIAVVAQPQADEGKIEISTWVDGVKYGKINVASAAEISTDQYLVLGHGKNYHVKLACVTVTKGAKSSTEFLRGYKSLSAEGMVIYIR